MNKTKSGFTIVELLIVIVVIGILAAITVVAYNGIQQRTRDTKRISDMRNVKQAIEMYYVDNGEYPGCNNSTVVASGCNFAGLVAPLVPKYIASVPSDPINTAQQAYYYSRGYKKSGPMNHVLTNSSQDYSIGTYLEAKGEPSTTHWSSRINFMDGN